MSQLKNINLKDLGIKNEKKIVEKFVTDESEMELFDAEISPSLSSEHYLAKAERFPLYSMKEKEARINYTSNTMNSKFLQHVKFIENIKDKPGQYFDKRTEWEKELEPEEFTPPSVPAEKTIPLTFRKFFYHAFLENITDFALKNPEKVSGLITGVSSAIQKDAQTWLDFISDKQVSTLLCQADNYSEKGKIYKKSDQFQNIVEVIQWIIDTNTKLLYESADWNKDGEKTFIREKESILIIDTTLHKEIEVEEERMRDFRYKDKYKENPKIFPLPLHRLWERFATVIVFPLKNNFQFIIIDKRALVGWKVFQNLEIKYDETNSTTYFCRKMEGGFNQLTHYNAVAFISE